MAADPTTASATAKAYADIVAIVTLSKGNDLVFGSLAPSGSIGNCVISTKGVRSFTNVYAGVGGTVPAAATFNLGGKPGTSFTIGLPTSANVYLGGVTSGASMEVTEFEARLESKSEDGLTGGVVGTDSYFTVGAKIAVGASQDVGSYYGDFSVSVSYE